MAVALGAEGTRVNAIFQRNLSERLAASASMILKSMLSKAADASPLKKM